VDYIAVGQAFHWFDARKARTEFARVLKPGGYVILVWNSRDLSSPFMREYEEALSHAVPAYRGVSERNFDDSQLAQFYAPSPMRAHSFENIQTFGWESVYGRLLSSSYVPLPGDPAHEPLIARVREIFERHQTDGVVRFEYKTRLYYGQLTTD
jgi:SAM-dependent methyltransferase